MIGRRLLEDTYLEWNRTWGAPFGRNSLKTMLLANVVSHLNKNISDRLRGAFAFQGNSNTRTWEYPWAYFAAPVEEGLNVLDIGGGYSGFAFALDKSGCEVTVVDPGGEDCKVKWQVRNDQFEYMNKLFGTSVKLVPLLLSEVDFSDESIDRIYCISVIEHLDMQQAKDILQKSFELLRPGGTAVLTVDLFLNLTPFSKLEHGRYGTNASIYELLQLEPRFQMIAGDSSELYGFPEFNTENVLGKLDKYLIASHYPTLSQCLVLEKPVQN